MWQFMKLNLDTCCTGLYCFFPSIFKIVTFPLTDTMCFILLIPCFSHTVYLTVQMMVYLVVQLVEEFETDATKPDIATNKVQS